jgi:hypothetical protein
LHDLEQLFRERDERMSLFGQMFANAGAMWQINGPNAPSERVPQAAVPAAGKVAAPGPGNAINPVNPWMPAYQIDTYLKEIEHKIEEISGISETLKGLRTDASGSSKALRTEVSMYVPRIGLPRQMFYKGMILDHWRMAARMWEHFDPKVRAILDKHYAIEITAPEIVAHDDLEQMNRAVTGVQNRIISASRGRKWVGVVNTTEEEQEIIREQTNGALNPGPVTQQVQLLAATRQLGIDAQAPGQQGGETIQQQAIADLQARRQAAAQAQNNPPPPGGESANTAAVAAPGSLPPNAQANGAALTSQTMLQNGKESGRILSSSEIPVGKG